MGHLHGLAREKPELRKGEEVWGCDTEERGLGPCKGAEEGEKEHRHGGPPTHPMDKQLYYSPKIFSIHQSVVEFRHSLQ